MPKGLFLHLANFILLFLITSIFPTEIHAQTCPGQVVIDTYKCKDPEFGVCDNKPVPNQTGYVVSCAWNGSSCMSTSGVCSSNDTCSFVHDIEHGDYCACSFSRVDCNNPPDGGEGGGSCT